MPFKIDKKIELCKRSSNQPGCCWYGCDNKDEEICYKCYSCLNNCPNNVFELINGETYVVNAKECVGCRICEEMCPNNAITVEGIATDEESILPYNEVMEIQRKSKSGSYKIRSCGSLRKIPTFDDLIIIPAQVSRPPLDIYREKCKTEVVLGKRFAKNPLKLKTPIMIGAMSFGALSKEAKMALAIGSSLAGTATNTGEGGMLPEEKKLADKLIAQYASGRFGVSADYLNNADAIEIKIGQGAKSGMGGHLLGEKVTAEVSKIRGIPEGSDALSPARHMDIVGPEDLSMKISQLREITDWKIPIMVKFAAGRVEDDVKIAAKGGADIIVIDGMQGGTGAGPDIIMEHAGIPTISAILKADKALKDINLRDDVNLVVGGGIRNGADLVKAIALGADAVYIATSALVSLGCMLCRDCYKGVCKKGIATQDLKFRHRLNIERSGQNLANFIHAMTQEACMLVEQAGNSNIKNIEKQDLRSLSSDVSKLTGVMMV